MDNMPANVRDAEMRGEASKVKSASTDLISLNFKVTLQTRLHFKVYAATHDMTMTELLLQLFEERLRADCLGSRMPRSNGNKEIKK
jgi:hypothetical protein